MINSKKQRIQEINSKLGNLETRIFMLNMIDYQSNEDKALVRRLWNEQQALMKELEELEQ